MGCQSSSGRVEFFAGFNQLIIPGIPGFYLAAIFQRGVALMEYPLVTGPKTGEIWFHVEQAPVQNTAPVFGILLKIVVGIGGNHL